ncbi:hypothetical protein MHYP_G00336820 [Metynnis hypsauchen]
MNSRCLADAVLRCSEYSHNVLPMFPPQPREIAETIGAAAEEVPGPRLEPSLLWLTELPLHHMRFRSMMTEAVVLTRYEIMKRC